jgi:MoaA/NifB/PqqE/SkfB family radical SAM enzyme
MWRRSYYLASKNDPFLKSAWKQLRYRRVPTFPKTIQIETFSGCNAACIFCDWRINKDTVPRGKMNDTLFRKIIDECALHSVQRISPFLTNEPLLDKALEDKLIYIRKKIPRIRLVLNTNGSLLSEERSRSLIDSKTLNTIYISFQGITKDTYEKSMVGLDFNRNLHNVNFLLDYLRGTRLKRPKVRITMVKTRLIEDQIQDSLRYWKNRGVEATYTVLQNRAGSVDEARDLATSGLKRYLTCDRPFRETGITFDGQMLLCCVDYARHAVLGDVRERSIFEVWNDEKVVALRRTFLKGNLNEIASCRGCSVDAC